MPAKTNLLGKKFGRGTVIRELGRRPGYTTIWWLLKCDCGREYESDSSRLNHGIGTNCGCKKSPCIIGLKFGYDCEVIDYIGPRDRKYNLSVKLWLCKCSCGKEFKISRKDLRWCKSCGCKVFRYKKYKEISAYYWKKIVYGAKIRNLELNITQKYIWNLFLKQEKKCALTDLPLIFGPKKIQTASLDRIDSSKGYIKGNVQWVYRTINWMKLNSTQKDFINYCKLVAFKFKDKDE